MIRGIVVDDRTAQQPSSILELAERRLQSGSATRFGFEDGWHTLEEVDELSDRCAEFFRGLGVTEGDRIAAMLHNSLDHVVAWFAASKLGAIFAPVNTSYKGEWLLHQLADADPAVIVVESELAGRGIEVARALPSRVSIIVRDAATEDSAGTSAPTGELARFAEYRRCDRVTTRFRPLPSTTSHIIYTSGTTGRSKGCVISHGYLINYARLRLAAVPRLEGEASFTALPLFHIAGLGGTVGNLIIGGDAYLARRFSVSKFWSEIESSGARYVQLLGSMAPILAKAPDTEQSRRCFGQIRVLTGSAVPEVNEALHDRFGVRSTAIKFYGQTEAAPIATSDERPIKEDSIGVPSDSFDVRVLDELDREVPAGVIGQIACRPTRPDVMFNGYWRNPEATLAKSTTLWWHTGDYGWLDEDGYLHFSDRGDDRLRRGGENVSSHELETVVSSHPEVASVAAHAVPSELGEDEIKLSLVRRPGSALTAAELWQWCMQHLPKFAVPRYIEFRTALPLTPSGKIQKHLLRSEGVTAATWDKTGETDGRDA